MGPYNAFTGTQRAAAQTWLRRQWAAGVVPRPAKCCACGQTGGEIQSHAEDYSAPFGPHIYAYPLCVVCHGALHYRFRWPIGWDWYRRCIAGGARFRPATSILEANALLHHCGGRQWMQVEPPSILILESIHRGGAPAPHLPRVTPVSLVFAPLGVGVR